MYRILVALDQTVEHAVAQAEAIAEIPYDTDDLTVTLLHVFTDNAAGASVEQLETARTAKRLLREEGIDAQLDEASGDPSAEILKYATENDIGLICLGGRKRSPAGKALFGSVTQDVILGTDLPVLVCGDDE